VDDFAADALRQRQRQRGFAARGWAHDEKRAHLKRSSVRAALAQRPRLLQKAPVTAHALVFVAPPDDKPAYREALLMLGRVALARKLPPPDVLSGWESAQWIYESVDGDLRQEAAAAVAELPVDWAL